MIAVHIKNKVFKGAEDWNELDGKTLLRVAKILFSGKPEDEVRAQLVFTVFGLGGWFAFNLARHFKRGFLAAELVNKLMPEVDWLLKTNTLTKQLLPKIEIRDVAWKETFYGPSSNFENLTMKEFSDAEFLMQQWQLTQETQWLYMMMATLYRKGDKSLIVSNGDARYKYNFHGNDERTRMMKKLPLEYAHAVLLWYNGCRAKLASDYEFLFEKRSEQIEEAEAQQNTAGTWVDLIHSLGGAEMGTIDQVGDRTVRQVFFELRRRRDVYEDLKIKHPEIYK